MKKTYIFKTYVFPTILKRWIYEEAFLRKISKYALFQEMFLDYLDYRPRNSKKEFKPKLVKYRGKGIFVLYFENKALKKELKLYAKKVGVSQTILLRTICNWWLDKNALLNYPKKRRRTERKPYKRKSNIIYKN
jgi:hypothetical protein